MKKYIITIHSFIDVITNSSSEIFVAANAKTLKSVQAVVDNILKAGGSTKKATDLFHFELMVKTTDDDYEDVLLPTKSPAGKRAISESEDNGNPVAIILSVRALDGSPEAKEAAKVLSALTDLFDISEHYNG